MQVRKHVILGVLTFCLIAALLVGVSSSADYDPWCDVNDDGIIDIVDIVSLAIRFGEEGEPFAAKAAWEYDSGWLNITDKQGQYFNVTHNLNLVNQSVMPRLYGKENAESPPSSKYWHGFGLPGWNQTYGGTDYDDGYSVVQAGDGGYAIAGTTCSFGDEWGDVYLVKTDSNGNMEWNQTYGTAEYDYGESVVQAGDGGYAIAGTTYSVGADEYDFYLVKTDADGNMEWNQTYGGTNWDLGYSVVQAGDGGYAIAGETRSFGAGGGDVWLVKTDVDGNMEWNQTYGGTNYDGGSSVVQTGDGGYAIAGETESFGAVYTDFYLVKTDSNGNMEWNQTYGTAEYDYGESMVQAGDGGYAIAGQTGMMPWDIYFVKTDSSGNMEWNQTYGEWGTFDYGFSVVQTVDGGYAIAGTTGYMGNPDFYLVKTDADGNMEWDQTYGGTDMDYGRSMVQTVDGGYAIAGYTFLGGTTDVYLVKTDPFGLVEPKTGLWITSVDADTLTLYRGTVDFYWNYVRIIIWVVK